MLLQKVDVERSIYTKFPCPIFKDFLMSGRTNFAHNIASGEEPK
jgi:hypothetical protein